MKTMRVLTSLLVALWFGVGWVQMSVLTQMPVLSGLEQLLRGEPPIMTSLNDAVTDVLFLDDFNSSRGLIPRRLRRSSLYKLMR